MSGLTIDKVVGRGGVSGTMTLDPAANRTCSGCTSCCSLLRIVEINKPAGVTCPNCTGSGCGVYKTRPNICARFKCLWLVNPAVNERDYWKPDYCGIVAYASVDDTAMYFVCTDQRWQTEPWWTDIRMIAAQMPPGVRTFVLVGETETEVEVEA
jgi:hypothetical protein